jgi:hypothetical protein
MPNLTTFFWRTSSFSGSGQLNIGPEFIGHVNKFFRVQVRGEVNYQGASLTDTSVLANILCFGVQQVPHTAAAEDLISSVDSETFFTRRQSGSQDTTMGWAPSSDTGALIATVTVTDDWYGQLAVGLDTDVWVSFKASDGGSLANLNTYGTVRLWWG